MMFGAALIPEVFNGNKTVTRRPGSTHYKVGNEQAIQPGRGRHSMGRLVITKVTEEELGCVDDAEAKLEGFSGHRQFVEYWIQLYGSWDPKTKVKRIEFRVVEQTHKLCPTCDGFGVMQVGVSANAAAA